MPIPFHIHTTWANQLFRLLKEIFIEKWMDREKRKKNVKFERKKTQTSEHLIKFSFFLKQNCLGSRFWIGNNVLKTKWWTGVRWNVWPEKRNKVSDCFVKKINYCNWKKKTNAVQPRLWMLTLGGGFHCVNGGRERMCQWKNSYCTCVWLVGGAWRPGGRGLILLLAPVIAELCFEHR